MTRTLAHPSCAKAAGGLYETNKCGGGPFSTCVYDCGGFEPDYCEYVDLCYGACCGSYTCDSFYWCIVENYGSGYSCGVMEDSPSIGGYSGMCDNCQCPGGA
jgi:hypothetical protein